MDISYLGLALGLLLLLYPILIFAHLKLKLSRQLFISVGRMILQLSLVGIWLEFLFNQQRWWLTLIWMLIMIGNAIFTVKGRLKYQGKILLPVISIALFTSSIIIMPWILIMIVKPQPLYSPMYVIPLYGMILGNGMNSCALALERFESGLADNWQAYFTRISLGANLWEAALPPFRKAMHAALLPQLLSVASIGLVSLPGMMTGQILGGASPLVAIKYQMMIMFAIFSGVTITDYVAIRLYLKKRFDKFYLPKGGR
ncbi:MAG: iron export ABC transporter permease subunit FetB [Candidatus Cloacimonadaceae bacterium]|jgi:putative ABC transport system permease protein|nr:iron export ABC transporter permease subunit FetB [Candidatus Cloacimonadota bacterium]MDY0127214.1 iron export ABC transporter permease subunit FetB [Candidatus Cloacimonadaceae bacterium]MCB5254803.1 iron export ABC transporter permease subunit FetB [Candidatus Cloacimonadota bacterium]MCK9178973.1 iron export ABC transporter permease subunit FetB [Candidatus Cloacimonadota bacterium]MCK9243204.1 iron export ABC transporter permease subunit FetB [Candidatus Cloacimonadota bacterium]